MTGGEEPRNPAPSVAPTGPILWLTDWEAALAQARATRRPLLIDVWKDP